MDGRGGWVGGGGWVSGGLGSGVGGWGSAGVGEEIGNPNGEFEIGAVIWESKQ